MKAELLETLKQSVEILQNDMTKEDEPVWLGTLWNVDASLAKMAEKYLADEKQKQFELLDNIAVENEKKNQRIRELEAFANYILNTGEDSGREGCTYGDTDYDSLSAAYGYNTCLEQFQEKAKQLLNQKP